MKYSARVEKTREGFSLVFPDLPELRVHVLDLKSAASVAHTRLNAQLGGMLARGSLPMRPSKLTPGPQVISVVVEPQHALTLQVRWARQEQGLTLESVARRMGVSRQRVAALEDPQSNWTMATLQRLSDALDADLDIILRPRRK